jgi:hypothetical protein
MRSAVYFVCLSLLVYSQTAAAQVSECAVCRVMYHFGQCPETVLNNAEGGIAVIGNVAAIKPMKCGTRIRVNVMRSSATASFPSAVDIDTDSCMIWSGAIGDKISGLISETPGQEGAYSALSGCGKR